MAMLCPHCYHEFRQLMGHRCPVCLAVYRTPTNVAKKTKQSIRSKRMALLVERDGRECRACGARRKLTIDHVMPLSRGGGWCLDNLQILCTDCNGLKADSLPEPALR